MASTFGLAARSGSRSCWRRRSDVGDLLPCALAAAAHRAETWPLFQATRVIVGLFTDDRHPAMAPACGGALRLACCRLVRWARALLMQRMRGQFESSGRRFFVCFVPRRRNNARGQVDLTREALIASAAARLPWVN